MSDRFGKVSDVASFAQSTYVPLFQLQTALVASEKNEQSSSEIHKSPASALGNSSARLQLPSEAISSAALAVAMTNLIMSFPYQLSRGHSPIPIEIEQAVGLQAADLEQAHQNHLVPEAMREMAAVAGQQLSIFQSCWKTTDGRLRRRLSCAFMQVVSPDSL